ncbi:MAG: hypothetical protein ACI9VM_000267 [Candidatus Azotimanducaceae bacterium]|jgi:hypothetical protein
MFFTVHILRALVLVCVPFVAALFVPLLAHAQENAEVASTSEVTVIVEPAVAPYKLEALIGDKILGDFVLSPGKVELEIAPGESKTVLLGVSNRMAEARIFNFDVEDVNGSKDINRSVLLLGDDTGPYTLKDYISIPHATFELDRNLRAVVPVTVSIPEDAEPGGRYGSVLVNTLTQQANTGLESNTAPSPAIVSRIGALFFVTIPGEANESGGLQDFSTFNNQKWFQNGPIDFQMVYENSGSIHLNPYGELRIWNMLNEEVGFVELEPWFTLPQSLRLRDVSWDRELLYGRYTATLKLNRGYDDIVDEQTITFWVIPWKIVLGGLAVLFVLFFITRGFFRKFEFKRKDN